MNSASLSLSFTQIRSELRLFVVQMLKVLTEGNDELIFIFIFTTCINDTKRHKTVHQPAVRWPLMQLPAVDYWPGCVTAT